MANAGEATLNLGFQYDPKKLDAFFKDIEKTKETLGNTESTLGKLGKGLSGLSSMFGGLGKAAATALAAFSGKKLVQAAEDLEKLGKSWAYYMKGVEDSANKATKNLRGSFNLGVKEAQILLRDLQKELLTLGIGPKESLKIGETLVKRARDVSIETGEKFEEVLDSFKSYLFSEDLSGIARLRKLTEHKEKAVLELRQRTVSAQTAPEGRAKIRFQDLQDWTQLFEGAYERSGALTKDIDELQAAFGDFKTLLVQDLTPALRIVVDVLNKALIPTLQGLTKVISVLLLGPAVGGLNLIGAPVLEGIDKAVEGVKSLHEKYKQGGFKNKISAPDFLGKKGDDQSSVINNNQRINLNFNIPSGNPEEIGQAVKHHMNEVFRVHQIGLTRKA